jgi:hypothetical protein
VESRIAMQVLGRSFASKCSIACYAAPKRTETSFDTPGSCMVTP